MMREKRGGCQICHAAKWLVDGERCQSCRKVMIASRKGVSYGKLVALEYENEQKFLPKSKPDDQKEPVLLEGEKICPACGTIFYAKGGKKKYCDSECGEKFRERRTKLRKAESSFAEMPYLNTKDTQISCNVGEACE